MLRFSWCALQVFFKGHWQYKISLSHSKELLKLYIKLYYRFVISCLVLKIFRPKLILEKFLTSLTMVLMTSGVGLTI
jgi:hypothetical protein